MLNSVPQEMLSPDQISAWIWEADKVLRTAQPQEFVS